MSRPIVGTDLQTATANGDFPYIEGMEFRTADGSYWRRESDGLCHMLNGGCTPWNLGRVLRAEDGPAIVTYVPPVPSPHTRPGHYVCTGTCAYRYQLDESGLWNGPYRPDGTDFARTMTWEQLEDNHGDCAASLVGPVPAVVLKGL